MPKVNAINQPAKFFRTITGTTLLNKNDIGKVIEVAGSSSSIFLPSPGYQQPNKIQFISTLDQGETCQILSDNGNLFLSMGPGESLSLVSNGVEWLIDYFNWFPAFFEGFPTTDQTLTNATPALLALGNSTTAGFIFASDIYTALYGGSFTLNATVRLKAVAANTLFSCSIFAGAPGSEVSVADQNINILSGNTGHIVIPDRIVLLNTGDNIWLQVQQTSGVNEIIDATQLFCSFSGKRVNYI